MTTAPFTAVRTECTPINFNYTVKFDRTITSPKEWQEEIDTIRLTKAGDHVTVYVNTNGGSIATLTEILHAIDSSEAYFHCVLAGNAYSAGGPIMLACDSVEVGKFADCFIHTSQSGYGGSSDALKSYSDHTAKTADKLLRDCYEGFCTDEELDQALMGREFWFDADEIVRRLQVRNEYREAKSKVDVTKETIDEIVEVMCCDLMDTSESLNMNTTDLLELLSNQLSLMEPVELSEVELPKEDVVLNSEDDKYVWPFEFYNEFGDYLNINREGFINFGDGNYPSFSSYNTVSTPWFRVYADMLGIKYAHNISRGKLIARMDNKVKELVASLDK